MKWSYLTSIKSSENLFEDEELCSEEFERGAIELNPANRKIFKGLFSVLLWQKQSIEKFSPIKLVTLPILLVKKSVCLKETEEKLLLMLKN